MNERTETHACDCIERQAAIDALGERPMVWAESDYELGARNQYDADVLALETVPPAQPDLSAYSDKLWRAAYERGKKEAEPERKRGKWVKVSADKYRMSASYFYECSRCKFVNHFKSNFCPVCGAAMGGIENG